MRSCEHESLTGDSILQQLKLEQALVMPDKIAKLTAICTTINMSIHDDVRHILDAANGTRWVATELDRIRAICHAPEDKKGKRRRGSDAETEAGNIELASLGRVGGCGLRPLRSRA